MLESPSLLPVQQFSPAVASVDHTAETVLLPQPPLSAYLCRTYLKTPALSTCSKFTSSANCQALSFFLQHFGKIACMPVMN